MGGAATLERMQIDHSSYDSCMNDDRLVTLSSDCGLRPIAAQSLRCAEKNEVSHWVRSIGTPDPPCDK